LLIISAGLTSATLLIVSYSVRNRVRMELRTDLRNSVKTYEAFERQKESKLSQSSQLVANLPNVRALMTTQDAATIQDASVDVWHQSGSDLLVLASSEGGVFALQANRRALDGATAQNLLHASLKKGEDHDWWFDGTHLYKVWIQPVYLSRAAANSSLGFLIVGDEIDQQTATEFSDIASSDVAFRVNGSFVVGTLAPELQSELSRKVLASSRQIATIPQDLQLGKERYLTATVDLSPGSSPDVSLTLFKSFDKATLFLSELNRILLGLGLLSIVAGSAMVFVISRTFTRPLENLVDGVRALDKGDFSYTLNVTTGDEVGLVTSAFDRMRTNLHKNQQEQKALEERLRQAHKMEAVGRLAGGIAHDFNNLLTIISGNGDLLSDREGADDFHRRCVDQIQKASRRAVTMTRQLLAFSRMQVLQPRVLDLNNVVTDLGKMLPRLIGEQIEYEFAFDPKLSPIKADPGQIDQVIMNLAVNSRDAMPNGGKLTVQTVNVTMSAEEAAKRPPMTDGPYVLLTVADTGQGMTAETKAHIFEPFFTTKAVGKGTGLGLATVYGIVKQSGGFIWVESTLGKGTTFEIYFPQATGAALRVEEESKTPMLPRGTETILVVEDEPGVRDIACRFLRVKGYSVLEAKDGMEALQIANQSAGTIDVMLTDMVMPKMGGEELARQIKEARPEIKIIFMSGYSEYLRGNPDDGTLQSAVLQKPFSPSTLVGTVRDVIGKKSAEARLAVK